MGMPQILDDSADPPRVRAARFVEGRLGVDPLVAISDAMLDDGLTLAEFVARERLKYSTVVRWLRDDEDRWAAYERAVDAAADKWAMESLRIADDAQNDWMEQQQRDGSVREVVNTEVIQRSKLRIDTRLRIAKQLSSQRWGERLDISVTERPSIRRVLDEMEARLAKADVVDGEFVEVVDDGRGV